MEYAREIIENVWLGSNDACTAFNRHNQIDHSVKMAVVHLCTDPCYYDAYTNHSRATLPQFAMRMGFQTKVLFIERDDHLYVAIDDSEESCTLRRLKQIEQKVNDFVDRYYPHTPVLFHCNAGISRSPTFVYLYLRHVNIVKNENEFRRLCPQWMPNPAIQRYIRRS